MLFKKTVSFLYEKVTENQLILSIFTGSKVRTGASAQLSSLHFWQGLISPYISSLQSLSCPHQPPLTQPFTAIELHSHADVHGVVCDRHEADEASDDGRLEVLEYNDVGVPVSFNHLQVK